MGIKVRKEKHISTYSLWQLKDIKTDHTVVAKLHKDSTRGFTLLIRRDDLQEDWGKVVEKFF